MGNGRKFSPVADPQEMADKLRVEAEKLQHLALGGVDHICDTFKAALGESAKAEEVESVKQSLVVRPIMQAVSAIRAQRNILLGVANGRVTLRKKEVSQ